MTTPMESDRVAQKMSETHIKLKHLCIWVTHRKHTVDRINPPLTHTQNIKPSIIDANCPSSHSPKQQGLRSNLPLMTFSRRLWCEQHESGWGSVWVGWNRDSHPLLCEPSGRVCRRHRRPMASAAPSCTQHERVTNWCHVMGSSVTPCFSSLSPSETCDWKERLLPISGLASKSRFAAACLLPASLYAFPCNHLIIWPISIEH